MHQTMLLKRAVVAHGGNSLTGNVYHYPKKMSRPTQAFLKRSILGKENKWPRREGGLKWGCAPGGTQEEDFGRTA